MSVANRITYFFDTSALVKRYHQEAGTDVVDDAFDDTNAVIIISDLSIIELYSAFAKKVRIGEIGAEDFRATIKTIAADLDAGVIQLVVLGDTEKKEAAALIEQYGVSRSLRTLDAMQLAVMNKLGRQTITRVYCADQHLPPSSNWKDTL